MLRAQIGRREQRRHGINRKDLPCLPVLRIHNGISRHGYRTCPCQCSSFQGCACIESDGLHGEDSSFKGRCCTEGGGTAHLPENIGRQSSAAEYYFACRRRGECGGNLNDENCVGITFRVKGQVSGRYCE